jgi:hypothetical protein
MMTAGVLVAGGIIWWLAGRSAPQAAGPIAAARGNPAPLDDPFPALAPDAPAAPAQPRLRPDWGGPFDGRAPGFDPFPGFGGNVNGVHVQTINGELTARSRQDGLVITITGTVASGGLKVRLIKVEDGNETFDGASVEGVPEKYRAAVRALLEHKLVRDAGKPPAPAAPPPNSLNTADKPPPIADLFAAGPRVFVSDLKEFGVVNGPWPVTKDGTTGAPENRKIKVADKPSPHGLGMHPPSAPGSASIKFRPGKKAAVFKATVAIDDDAHFCFTPAVFTVWGDGKKLFESRYIAHNHARSQECSVDVTGVDVLELRVQAVGHNHGVHAVWFEPRLLQKSDTADK